MKGHRQALLAVEQLIAEGFNIHLNVYGFELEIYADFIRQMKKLAERPLLKGRVTFHGFVDDAMDINRQNHIIFSASLAEGLPQALAFHQAAGLLPVASPAGGIPEIVVDGQTGFLAQGFEVEHLVVALRRALLNRATGRASSPMASGCWWKLLPSRCSFPGCWHGWNAGWRSVFRKVGIIFGRTWLPRKLLNPRDCGGRSSSRTIKSRSPRQYRMKAGWFAARP